MTTNSLQCSSFALNITNMKRILSLAFLLIATTGFSQTEKKVLFIGNSYTSANNLPDLVNSLAQAAGNSIIAEAHIPGGSQLSQHAVNSTVLNLISSKDWDYVILQDQSQKPSFPDAQVQADVYPYAEILADSVYSNNECSVPLFYGTWGRQNGDSQWVGINTFEKMNGRLFNAYTYMANDAEGMLSPVGIGFAHVKQAGVGAVVNFNDLYTSDESHPTIKGSYLAACIFNNIIFNGVSTGNTFLPAGMTSNETAYLQGVADHVVYAVDSVQIDFRPDLTNNTFSTAVNSSQVTFTPTITDGDFESWDFGDGQTSTQENAIHTYTNNGIYEVTMYTSANCQFDSLEQDVDINVLGISNEEMLSFNVYPNPSSDGIVTIDLKGKGNYSVFTLLGKEIYEGNTQQITLSKGVYIVRYKNETRKITVL